MNKPPLRYGSLRLAVAGMAVLCITLGNARPAAANNINHNVTNTAEADIEVRGVVKDSKGLPLPGVTVMAAGTKTGTVTDNDGKFAIRVNAGTLLRFTFMGYATREVTVNDGTALTIVMKETVQNLNDVVVTALGVKKERQKLGYSVQEVKGESLTQAREANVVNQLTGRVAGLVVQSSTDLFQNPGISLRGRTPLIVIDGIPDVTADFYKINADDIESMSVLKGANAAALYGSIGENGAIMITTKRGKGTSTSFNFNSSTQFQTGFIRVPDVQTKYGAGNNGQYAYVNGLGSGTEGAGWIWGPELDRRVPNTASGYWETTQYNSPSDPQTGKLVPIPYISRGRDNIKNFFNTGMIASNNLAFTQSSDKGFFRASASHIYQKGIVPNTNLNNSSFNLAGSYTLTDAVTLNGRISYNKEYSNNFPEVGYGPTNYLYNLVLWTGADVDVRDLRSYWMPGKEGLQQRNYNTSWYNNPYFQAYEYLRGYNKDNTFGSLELNYRINQNFGVLVRTGINTYGLNRDYKEPKSYIGYGNKSRGQYTIANSSYLDIVTDGILSYNHTFSNNFRMTARLGASNYFRNQTATNSVTDGLSIPGLYNLANSTNPISGTNIKEQRRTASVYGTVDLELYKAFYVTVTGRNDWLSTLPLENNSFFYPSISASAVLSSIWQMPAWISFLKTRAALSRVSSGKISDGSYTYSYLTAYDKGTIWNNTPSLTYPRILSNASLKPQTSDSWEAGVEAKFFKNRLSIDATYYQARDFNNIITSTLSLSSGFASRYDNADVYTRKGFELTVGATPVKTADVTWNINMNISQNHRYLSKITQNIPRVGYLKPGDRTDMTWVQGYETDGHGNMVIDKTGMPASSSYLQYVGTTDPVMIYGLDNSIRYKNFNLGFLIDGRLGGQMYSTTTAKMWWGGKHKGTLNQYRVDANEGKNTYVAPGVVQTGGQVTYDNYGNILSDTRTFAKNETAVNYISFMQSTYNDPYTNYNYYSQSFLKLRELSIGYTYTGSMLKGLIKGLSVTAVGRNLLLLSKIKNVDPDTGIDNLQTPATRNIGINVNLKF